MDPITITATALSIIKATGLSAWIGRRLGGEPGERASARIVETAEGIVGGSPNKDVVKTLKADPAMTDQVRLALVAQEAELVELNMADMQDARAMYKQKNAQADKVATTIMRFNLPAILLLIVFNIGAIYFINNPTVAVAIGNLVGASISFLWQERQQVMGFFFGSSLGSKEKSELLSGRRVEF